MVNPPFLGCPEVMNVGMIEGVGHSAFVRALPKIGKEVCGGFSVKCEVQVLFAFVMDVCV